MYKEIVYNALNIKDFNEKANKILEDKNLVNIKANSLALKCYFSLFLKGPKIMFFATEEDAFKFYQEVKGLDENIFFLPYCETASSILFASQRQMVDENRILSLNKLLNKTENSLIITTPKAVIFSFKSKKTLSKKEINLKVGKTLNLEELEKSLKSLGYKKKSQIEEKGDFSFISENLSIYTLDKENPLRIKFFDNEIEDIKTYDLSSGFSIRKIDEANIFSILEVDKEKIDLRELKKELNQTAKMLPNKQQEELENLLEEQINNFNENFLDKTNFISYYFKDNLSDISDYLDSVTIIFNDKNFILDILEKEYLKSEEEINDLIKKFKIFPNHKNILIDIKKVKDILERTRTINFSQNFYELEYVLENNEIYYKNYQALINDINSSLYDNNSLTYIYVSNIKRARLLQEGLRNNKIPSSILDYDRVNSNIIIIPEYLPYGFYSNENKIRVIGSTEIYYGMMASLDSFKKKRRAFTIPKIGDYVVHINYGIAICKGLKKILLSDQVVEKDFLVLEFAENSTLSIPMEQLDKIYKYSGTESELKLSKLGSDNFRKTKERARKSIKEIAFSLSELYKKREIQKGYKYKEDTDLQIMLERDFEFEETEDQIIAIQEIKQDMQNARLMDRLVCGDVGYGKTEVALRIVFKTAIENKQVVILCPTTLLAKQHYNLFKSRFSKYGLEVEILTRLNNSKNQKEIIKRIKDHKIDVIISTHRILSKDIEFSDLGLLVIDEEQRFGVEQKEKIKNLKTEVNVLSLSATPIPRTLNMALAKIRDISVLTTPPKDRNPVKTYLMKENYIVIKEAIEKELERNGQVFILNNRIDTLETVVQKIKSLIPNIKVEYCYGSMDKKLFEKRIEDFYNNKINALVSTTIIENGIDIPNANTLIVLDANRFGLSQLYQIRGRVGRSKKQSYAYFFYKSFDTITDDSVKRLNALKENIDLGSGFKIAMRDLEIRGAGNLLGPEQSGHIDKVGYELYCQMIQEEVDKINNITPKKKVDTTNISIDIPNTIEDDYISDYNEKIKIYQEIASITERSEIQEIIDKLNSIYGMPSNTLINLIRIAYLKNLASELLITEIRIKNTIINVYFEEFLDDFLDNLKLYDLHNNANYLEIVDTKKVKSFKLIKKMKTEDIILYLTDMFEYIKNRINI